VDRQEQSVTPNPEPVNRPVNLSNNKFNPSMQIIVEPPLTRTVTDFWDMELSRSHRFEIRMRDREQPIFSIRVIRSIRT